MNKKLEEYESKLANTYFRGISFPNHQDKEDNFKAGFDAALDLPVKFANWVEDAQQNGLIASHAPNIWLISLELGEKADLAKHISTKELFQYYIDNVHKFE